MTTRLILIQNDTSVIEKARVIVEQFHLLQLTIVPHTTGLVQFEIDHWNLLSRSEQKDILHELIAINAQFLVHILYS